MCGVSIFGGLVAFSGALRLLIAASREQRTATISAMPRLIRLWGMSLFIVLSSVGSVGVSDVVQL
jgi:hypothetical protein